MRHTSDRAFTNKHRVFCPRIDRWWSHVDWYWSHVDRLCRRWNKSQASRDRRRRGRRKWCCLREEDLTFLPKDQLDSFRTCSTTLPRTCTTHWHTLYRHRRPGLAYKPAFGAHWHGVQAIPSAPVYPHLQWQFVRADNRPRRPSITRAGSRGCAPQRSIRIRRAGITYHRPCDWPPGWIGPVDPALQVQAVEAVLPSGA